MTLQFGKYKGQDIEEIPLDYLIWLEQQDFITASTRIDLVDSIKRRSGNETSRGRDVILLKDNAIVAINNYHMYLLKNTTNVQSMNRLQELNKAYMNRVVKDEK